MDSSVRSCSRSSKTFLLFCCVSAAGLATMPMHLPRRDCKIVDFEFDAISFFRHFYHLVRSSIPPSHTNHGEFAIIPKLIWFRGSCVRARHSIKIVPTARHDNQRTIFHIKTFSLEGIGCHSVYAKRLTSVPHHTVLRRFIAIGCTDVVLVCAILVRGYTRRAHTHRTQHSSRFAFRTRNR